MAGTVDTTAGARKARLGAGRRLGVGAGLLACGLFAPPPSAAQLGRTAPAEAWFAQLAAERPDYPGDAGNEAVVAHAVAGVPLRERITVAGGLSLIRAKQPDRAASTVLSNAWLSFHFGGEGGFATLTFTLPTSGRLENREGYASDAGLAAELETPERFTPSTTGVAVDVRPRRRLGPVLAGARGGLAVVAPSGFRREFYARYGVFAEGRARPVRLGAEVTGAAFLNPDPVGRDRTLGEVTVHHATLVLGVPGVPLAPDVYVRLPLDDDGRRAVRAVFGIRLRHGPGVPHDRGSGAP